MERQAIRLGYHPKEWRRELEGYCLERRENRDFGLVRLYREVITLLDCMGKVVEKVITKQLSQYCETRHKLYPGQMGARKERSAIEPGNGGDNSLGMGYGDILQGGRAFPRSYRQRLKKQL